MYVQIILEKNIYIFCRHWQKDFNKDVKNGESIACWFVDNEGRGLIDGTASDYTVSDLFTAIWKRKVRSALHWELQGRFTCSGWCVMRRHCSESLGVFYFKVTHAKTESKCMLILMQAYHVTVYFECTCLCPSGITECNRTSPAKCYLVKQHQWDSLLYSHNDSVWVKIDLMMTQITWQVKLSE